MSETEEQKIRRELDRMQELVADGTLLTSEVMPKPREVERAEPAYDNRECVRRVRRERIEAR